MLIDTSSIIREKAPNMSGSGYRKVETSGIGEEAHYDDGQNGAEQQVGEAASEAVPCAVAHSADDGLYD